jgi:hypothetical protein
MRRETPVFVTVLLVIISILAGYSFGNPLNQNTSTTGPGAEKDCGFAITCEVLGPTGLELSVSINSTVVTLNHVITVTANEYNTLHVTNIILPASFHWPVNNFTWNCPPAYFPENFGVFKGYDTLENLTSASPMIPSYFPTACQHSGPAGLGPIDNGTDNFPRYILLSVTSYSFSPQSSSASYTGFYRQVFYGTANLSYGPVALGTFIAPTMANFLEISSAYMRLISPPSTGIGAYTLVIGDEWGDLLLLHFNVT